MSNEITTTLRISESGRANMNELVKIQRNDVFTDTMAIADGTGNEHESVVRHLLDYRDDFEEFGAIEFTDLKSGKRGRPSRVYLLNEPQATLLITYLGNSEKVRTFKKELIRQFYEMRRILLQKQTADWQQTRLHGKQIRLQETDAIKALIEYATEQGSANAGKLYMVYTKLVKRLTGYERRDTVDVETLTEILAFERLLFGIITQEMTLNTPYKAIYQKAKRQLLGIKRLWATPRLSA